jgi:hypothetical protein
MKRIFRRLLETGAIFWLGMALLLFLGGLMAYSTETILISDGYAPRGIKGSTMRSRDASLFWFLAAGLLTWIGIAAWRLPGKKK